MTNFETESPETFIASMQDAWKGVFRSFTTLNEKTEGTTLEVKYRDAVAIDTPQGIHVLTIDVRPIFFDADDSLIPNTLSVFLKEEITRETAMASARVAWDGRHISVEEMQWKDNTAIGVEEGMLPKILNFVGQQMQSPSGG